MTSIPRLRAAALVLTVLAAATACDRDEPDRHAPTVLLQAVDSGGRAAQ